MDTKAISTNLPSAGIFNGDFLAVCVLRLVYDADGAPVDFVFEFVNEACERFMHAEPGSLLGCKVFQLWENADRIWLKVGDRVVKTGIAEEHESDFAIFGRYVRTRDFAFGEDLLLVFFEDLTSQRADKERADRLEIVLGQRNEGHAALIGMSNVLFCLYRVDLLDGSFEEVFARARFHAIFGERGDAASTISEIAQKFIFEKYRDEIIRFMDFSTLPERLSADSVITIDFEGIHVGWARIFAMPCDWDEHGNVTSALFAARMIQGEKSAERARDKALYEARTDALTSVRNRRAYLDETGEITRMIEAGDCKPFAVVTFDLNKLKQVNDSLGHEKGDTYILCIKDAICQVFSHSPIYRIGGDEFVGVLFGEDYDNRERLINEFKHRAIQDAAVLFGTLGGYSCAVGVSEYRPGEDESFSSVFNRADEQMYKDKAFMRAIFSAGNLPSFAREIAVANGELPGAALDGNMAAGAGSGLGAIAAFSGSIPQLARRKKRILVVEGDAATRKTLDSALSDIFEIDQVSSGLEGLDLFRKNATAYSAVMFDLNAAKMDGLQFLKEVRDNPDLAGVPIVISTADSDLEIEQRCMDLGACEFVYKPYNKSALKRRIIDVIEKFESDSVIKISEIDSHTGLFRRHAFLRYARAYLESRDDAPVVMFALGLSGIDAAQEAYGEQGFVAVLRYMARSLSDHFTKDRLLCHSDGGLFLAMCDPDDIRDPQFMGDVLEGVGAVVPAVDFSLRCIIAPDVRPGDSVAGITHALEAAIHSLKTDPDHDYAIITREDIAASQKREEKVAGQ